LDTESSGQLEGGEMKVSHFESNSNNATIAVGRQIVKLLAPPKFLILRGELGAGKTTLAKGVVEALDAAEPDEVTSPTFTLIHEYEGKWKDNGKEQDVPVYHLDLYRIEDERQLETLGLDEIAEENAIVLVEWGEKFPSVTKRSDGEILIEHAGGDARKITLTLKESEPANTKP
jgi:tRNA threonylcarbamoyladenosine biosynthesis protein TsaE